jgi:hypothetical protein
MLPLNVLLANLKTYANIIIGTVVVLAVVSTGVYIAVLRHERNMARAKEAVLQQVVAGYVAASKALQVKLDAADKALDDEDVENKKLLADLQASVPKNPAEANAWAIAAAQKIGKEAQR